MLESLSRCASFNAKPTKVLCHSNSTINFHHKSFRQQQHSQPEIFVLRLLVSLRFFFPAPCSEGKRDSDTFFNLHLNTTIVWRESSACDVKLLSLSHPAPDCALCADSLPWLTDKPQHPMCFHNLISNVGKRLFLFLFSLFYNYYSNFFVALWKYWLETIKLRFHIIHIIFHALLMESL